MDFFIALYIVPSFPPAIVRRKGFFLSNAKKKVPGRGEGNREAGEISNFERNNQLLYYWFVCVITHKPIKSISLIGKTIVILLLYKFESYIL